MPLKEIILNTNEEYCKIIKLDGKNLYFDSSNYSSIDKTFHDKKYSFRLMKLPEGKHR